MGKFKSVNVSVELDLDDETECTVSCSFRPKNPSAMFDLFAAHFLPAYKAAVEKSGLFGAKTPSPEPKAPPALVYKDWKIWVGIRRPCAPGSRDTRDLMLELTGMTGKMLNDILRERGEQLNLGKFWLYNEIRILESEGPPIPVFAEANKWDEYFNVVVQGPQGTCFAKSQFDGHWTPIEEGHCSRLGLRIPG